MVRVLLVGLTAVASVGAVVLPATLGLSGNASFDREIQVPLPSQARTGSSQGPQAPAAATVTPSRRATPTAVPSATGPAQGEDDRSGRPSTARSTHDADPGDDRQRTRGRSGASRSGEPHESGSSHESGSPHESAEPGRTTSATSNQGSGSGGSGNGGSGSGGRSGSGRSGGSDDSGGRHGDG